MNSKTGRPLNNVNVTLEDTTGRFLKDAHGKIVAGTTNKLGEVILKLSSPVPERLTVFYVGGGTCELGQCSTRTFPTAEILKVILDPCGRQNILSHHNVHGQGGLLAARDIVGARRGLARRLSETPREHALRVVQANVRASDEMERLTNLYTAARFGGDEFALVLPETGEAAAWHVARGVADRLATDAEKPNLSISVGVAVYPGHGETVEALLNAADVALYETKERRKSRAVGLAP